MPNNDSRTLTRYTKAAVVHKVIDITPVEKPSKTPLKARALQALKALKALEALQAPMARHRNILIGAGGAILALAVILLAIPHHGHKTVAATTPASPQVQIAPVVVARPPVPQGPIVLELNLPTAVQEGLVECQWRGNGKDRLVMDAENVSGQPLRLHLGAGQILASVDSTVVILKSQTLDFPPNGERHDEFATVATSSANKVAGAEYHLSAGTLPDLENLFGYVAAHPEADPGAIQTATLILTENLPLSAFAKFNELGTSSDGMPETQDFKAETSDILRALIIIRDLGVSRPLAVTIDPQLQVEAMIDPNAHALAVSYYGIANEWSFWKNQLLNGDPSTRHYALYGIARYYPDVAVQMLPGWARQETLSPVFRMSAVQALGQTGRADAIPILRDLELEFGGTSDLGHAAHLAANYLDAEFARSARPVTGLSSETTQDHRAAALAVAGN